MRIYAFDNLRMTSIGLVILFHAMCAYTAHVPWWYVQVSDHVERFTAFMAITDNFVMATMFFVSGYFAARSYLSRNLPNRNQISGNIFVNVSKQTREPLIEFLRNKTTRLLLPGYLNLLLISPLMFVIIAPNELTLASAINIYLDNWKELLSLKSGPVAAAAMAFHHHLWFVEVLFIVSITLMLLWPLLRPMLSVSKSGDSTAMIVFKFFLILSSAQLITFAVIHQGIDMFAWHSIGGITVVQPTRQGAYIAAFAAGIYFFSLQGQVPAKRIFALGFMALVLYFITFQIIAVSVGRNDQTTAMHIYMANNWIAMCGFFLMLMIAIFLRLFNREYRWLKPLYGLNYGIYLMHMVFIVLLQAVCVRTDLPVWIQVSIITVATFILGAACTYAKQRGLFG